MIKHEVLVRQIENEGIDINSLDEKTKKLLFSIDEFYFNQDESKSRLNRIIEILTEENNQLILRVKKKTELLLSQPKMMVLGEMACGIAHEINNPLMILQATISLIEEIVGNKTYSPEIIKKELASAEKTIDRIAAIVSGLKTFSCDDTLEPFVKVNLKDIVSETFKVYQDELKENNINVINVIEDNIYVMCRPNQISQVFSSLILNAEYAIAKSQEKWIKTDSIRIDGSVVLTFTDSGEGIPLPIQEKIMNPFFTTKPVGCGPGLGLSVAKGIIEAHNGEIKLNRQIRNTCFQIELPIVRH